MAKGDYWLKLDLDDWLNDPCCRGLKRENRDSWLTACLFMHREGTFFLEGPPDVLAKQLSLSESEFEEFISDLKRTKTADVTQRPEKIRIVSRRFHKATKVRQQNNLRKKKQRSKEHVTQESQESHGAIVNNYKLEDKKDGSNEPSKKPDATQNNSERFSQAETEKAIHSGKVLAGVAKELNLSQLPNKLGWINAADWAFRNGFNAEQFLECFILMRSQHWRTGAIRPTTVTENLPEIEKLRLDVANQPKNGNGSTSVPATPFVPKYCESCEKGRGFISVRVDGTPREMKCRHDPEQLKGLDIVGQENVTP
jgi:protein required for attachment to host cells